MNGKPKLLESRRRTRAEIQRLVTEFVSSGMGRSEFCRARNLNFGTLNRHLTKRRWKEYSRTPSADTQLVRVELGTETSTVKYETSAGLVVVLPGGRRIEVHSDFDASTFERLLNVLEGA